MEETQMATQALLGVLANTIDLGKKGKSLAPYGL
jgi:hypothetical protein